MARAGRPRNAAQRNLNYNRTSDEQVMALEARCRQMGIRPTQSNIDRMNAQQFGCIAGRSLSGMGDIIAEATAKEATPSDLFEAVTHIRAVVARYRRAIQAPNPNPQGMHIMVAPDPLTAGPAGDAATSRPQRTDEEEFTLATNAFRNLDSLIRSSGSASWMEVRSVVLEDHPVRSTQAFIAGLVAVWKGMKGISDDRHA